MPNTSPLPLSMERETLLKRIQLLEEQNSKLRMGLNSIVSNSPPEKPFIAFIETECPHIAYANGNDRAAQTLGSIARVWLKEAGPVFSALKTGEAGGNQ